MKARRRRRPKSRSLWLRQELVSGAVVKMTKTTRRQQKRPKGCNGSGKSRLAAKPPFNFLLFCCILFRCCFCFCFKPSTRARDTLPSARSHQYSRAQSQMHLTDARTNTGAAAMDAATTSGKRQQQHVHSFISSPLSFVFSHVRTLPLMHWEQNRLTKYVKRQQKDCFEYFLRNILSLLKISYYL